MSSRISGTVPVWTPSSTGCATSCSSSPDGASRRDGRAGRDGRLRLAFQRRGPRTILAEQRFTLPLQALGAMDLDESGTATVMLLNPTGGLVGGDVLETFVTLGPGSRVCLTTPSASRVYRSAGAPAVQDFTASLEGDASLEYVPDHLIPSPGARLRQRTDVTLARESTLVAVDAWAVGRIARGERWRFDQLDTSITVKDARGVLLKERAVLRGAQPFERLGGTEGFDYVATFVAIVPARDDWMRIGEDLSAEVEAEHLDVRLGVTPLARGGLIARLLCPTAPMLYRTVGALWSAARRGLLGFGPIALRKL